MTGHVLVRLLLHVVRLHAWVGSELTESMSALATAHSC